MGAERVASVTNRRSRPARSSYAARGSGAGGCARLVDRTNRAVPTNFKQHRTILWAGVTVHLSRDGTMRLFTDIWSQRRPPSQCNSHHTLTVFKTLCLNASYLFRVGGRDGHHAGLTWPSSLWSVGLRLSTTNAKLNLEIMTTMANVPVLQSARDSRIAKLYKCLEFKSTRRWRQVRTIIKDITASGCHKTITTR